MAHSSHPSGSREMTNGGGHPQAGGSPRYVQKRLYQPMASKSSSPMGRVILINAPLDGGEDCEDLHTITVDKSPNGRLGFSVRGGSEHGLGIFVSKVQDNSSAVQAGLCVGDKLVEVNGVNLDSITMNSAVKVLTGNNRLRMLVRRVGKIPGIRVTNEKTTWVDLIHRRMVVEENGCVTPSDASSDSALRRTVHLYTTPEDRHCLGFNIRGGREFGLGIYVSKMDPGGLAEQHGLKMGDQILAANGVSFDDITHSNAVEVLKSHTHVALAIREAGRYPAYKEMVAEYSWLNQWPEGPSPSPTVANGGPGSSPHDSCSSVSSLSSGTPLSSYSGLSFPLVFGSDMVEDVDIATEPTTEDRSRPSSAKSTKSSKSSKSTKSKKSTKTTKSTTDSAMQTDPFPPDYPDQASPRGSQSSRPAAVATESGRTVGATVLLKDTVVHGKGEGPREMGGVREEHGRGRSRTTSSGDRESARDSTPKTAEALMELSKPRKPIGRSQSHITDTEAKQKKKRQQNDKSTEEGQVKVQRSRTFMERLFKRDRKERSPSKSPSRHADRDKDKGRPKEAGGGVRGGSPLPRPDTLEQVELMAKRLLTQDEVTAVMRHCQRFLSDNVIEDLVRPLLAILDKPEKLLLLRDIRMLIPPFETGRFDSMVMPYELEAYDFLKTRSVHSPALRSPRRGTPRRHLITPVPDSRGGFHLQAVQQDRDKDRQLNEDLERLCRSGLHTGHLSASHAFTPLLDIPVDSYIPSARPSRTPSPSPSSHRESPRGAQRGRQPYRSPYREEDGASPHDEASLLSVSDRGDATPERGRSPVRNGHRRPRRGASPDSAHGRRTRQEEGYTETSVHVPSQQRPRSPLVEVLEPHRERSPSAVVRSVQQAHGHSQDGHQQKKRVIFPIQQYEIKTVTISKSRPSLGISISGGMECRIQPMIKIQKIFPGGAASTSDVLKMDAYIVDEERQKQREELERVETHAVTAGFELVSVDGESLQEVSHQHAVDVIRRSFGNRAKDSMMFVVKAPKGPSSTPSTPSTPRSPRSPREPC